MDVINELKALKDTDYKEFQSSLIPNIDPKTVIGVRTPALRKIAKELFMDENKNQFLKLLPHAYYEENQIHFMTISLIKDYEECVKSIKEFLPYVDNWAVADQSSPKVFRKNHDKLINEIKTWIASEHVYTSRFGMRMLMNEYLEVDFKPEYLELVAKKQGEDYYLKMMQAWFFATALAKQYDASVKYLEQDKLEVWVHNKTIQKAIESYRITNEQKEYLRTLKKPKSYV